MLQKLRELVSEFTTTPVSKVVSTTESINQHARDIPIVRDVTKLWVCQAEWVKRQLSQSPPEQLRQLLMSLGKDDGKMTLDECIFAMKEVVNKHGPCADGSEKVNLLYTYECLKVLSLFQLSRQLPPFRKNSFAFFYLFVVSHLDHLRGMKRMMTMVWNSLDLNQHVLPTTPKTAMLQILQSNSHPGICPTDWNVDLSEPRVLFSGQRLHAVLCSLHICILFRNVQAIKRLALDVFVKACYTLNYLHNGLLIAHRNISLSNILINMDTKNVRVFIRGFHFAAPVRPDTLGDMSYFNMYVNRFEATSRLLTDNIPQKEFEDGLKNLPNMFPRYTSSNSARDFSDQLPNTSMYCELAPGGARDPGFMAPEDVGDDSYNPFKADIYSMGVVLFTLVTGNRPYENFQDPNFKLGVRELVSSRGASISKRLLDLLESMLSTRPSRRPTLQFIIEELKECTGSTSHVL